MPRPPHVQFDMQDVRGSIKFIDGSEVAELDTNRWMGRGYIDADARPAASPLLETRLRNDSVQEVHSLSRHRRKTKPVVTALHLIPANTREPLACVPRNVCSRLAANTSILIACWQCRPVHRRKHQCPIILWKPMVLLALRIAKAKLLTLTLCAG